MNHHRLSASRMRRHHRHIVHARGVDLGLKADWCRSQRNRVVRHRLRVVRGQKVVRVQEIIRGQEVVRGQEIVQGQGIVQGQNQPVILLNVPEVLQHPDRRHRVTARGAHHRRTVRRWPNRHLSLGHLQGHEVVRRRRRYQLKLRRKVLAVKHREKSRGVKRRKKQVRSTL